MTSSQSSHSWLLASHRPLCFLLLSSSSVHPNNSETHPLPSLCQGVVSVFISPMGHNSDLKRGLQGSSLSQILFSSHRLPRGAIEGLWGDPTHFLETFGALIGIQTHLSEPSLVAIDVFVCQVWVITGRLGSRLGWRTKGECGLIRLDC